MSANARSPWVATRYTEAFWTCRVRPQEVHTTAKYAGRCGAALVESETGTTNCALSSTARAQDVDAGVLAGRLAALEAGAATGP